MILNKEDNHLEFLKKIWEEIDVIKQRVSKERNILKYDEFIRLVNYYYDVVFFIEKNKDEIGSYDFKEARDFINVVDKIFDFYCDFPKFKKMLIYYFLKGSEKFFKDIMNDGNSIYYQGENRIIDQYTSGIHFMELSNSISKINNHINQYVLSRFTQHLQYVYYDNSISFDETEIHIDKKSLFLPILWDMTASNAGFIGLKQINNIFNNDLLILLMYYLEGKGKDDNTIIDDSNVFNLDVLKKDLGIHQDVIDLFNKRFTVFTNELLEKISQKFKHFKILDGKQNEDKSFFTIEYKANDSIDVVNFVNEN